jgi:outer membrane protein assembly factor BamB
MSRPVRETRMTRLTVTSLTALLFFVPSAPAKITTRYPLESLVGDMPVILTAKVTEYLPDKPGMILTPVDKLRGQFDFDRVPVSLTGDSEMEKEKQLPILLERLDKDLTIVVFASIRKGNVRGIGFSNGTWFSLDGVVESKDGREATRWRVTHAEPYLRRTFRGTTDELLTAIRAGLKGEKLPAYDEKVEPGFGPPVKKTEGKKGPLVGPRASLPLTPFAVIQLPFLGLIAALAALFPALFGGLAIVMRRWVAALSVAGFVSLLLALQTYFPGWVDWTGVTTLSRAYLVGAGLAAVGGLWAGYRYRRAVRDGKGDEFQPRYADRLGLTIVLLLGGATLGTAHLLGEAVVSPPWLDLGLFLIPVAACLYFAVAHFVRTQAEPKPVGLSAETVGLWAGGFACALTGVTLMAGPRGPAMETGSGPANVKLDEQPVWVFNPPERGEILSTPCVTPERIYVTVHHRPTPVDQFGTVYALDPTTGTVIWRFDDGEKVKPLFCSPTFADGRLYFGEGYHTDKNSKMYCLDAAAGAKLWEFETTSHTESTPAVADGRVVFGAGDDGVYCLDTRTGEKKWQYPAGGGLHVDGNVAIHDGRVYGGSGTSRKSTSNRVFCLDLATGTEVWGEKVEHSCWGSPAVAGKHILFPTGNGTFSEDREPKAGVLLCRDAASGQAVWERALPNSLVGKPAADRYQVYVGCRDGNCYALDRHTGEVVWGKPLGAPILASPAAAVRPKSGVGELVYAVGSTGRVEALVPADGSLAWAVNLTSLVEMPHVNAVSSPVVVRDEADGKVSRRVFVALGFGSSPTATPNARLYCFRDGSE